jgi:hypothetical protein
MMRYCRSRPDERRGHVTKLAPERHRTLVGICRTLMAPGLYRDQEMDGRRLLQRLLRRAESPSALEVIIGVLLTARMCDQDIDPRIRAIIAVADIGTNPEDYPVEVIHEPFDHDLRDDGIAVWVENLVRAPAGEILSTDSQTKA